MTELASLAIRPFQPRPRLPLTATIGATLAVGTALGFATSANPGGFGCWFFAGSAAIATVGILAFARFDVSKTDPMARGNEEALLP